MMRMLRGIDEGLAALTRRPGYEEPQLTPAAAARTEALFGEPLTATQAVRLASPAAISSKVSLPPVPPFLPTATCFGVGRPLSPSQRLVQLTG